MKQSNNKNSALNFIQLIEENRKTKNRLQITLIFRAKMKYSQKNGIHDKKNLWVHWAHLEAFIFIGDFQKFWIKTHTYETLATGTSVIRYRLNPLSSNSEHFYVEHNERISFFFFFVEQNKLTVNYEREKYAWQRDFVSHRIVLCVCVLWMSLIEIRFSRTL